MGVKIGNIDVTFKVGSADCAVYLGDTLVNSGSTPTHDYSQDYFTIVPGDIDCDIQFTKATRSDVLYYAFLRNDIGIWDEWEEYDSYIIVNAGQKVRFKGTLTPNEDDGIGHFAITGNCSVEGNAMSLLFDDNFSGQTDLTGKNYAFLDLFNECSSLTSAENLVLPATTLSTNCYKRMFRMCTSLTTAPTLPAATYGSQFNTCYGSMFYGCASLNSITCLATSISSFRTASWVEGVAASGTFTKNANATGWTTGTNGIPSGWTVVDYSG